MHSILFPIAPAILTLGRIIAAAGRARAQAAVTAASQQANAAAPSSSS